MRRPRITIGRFMILIAVLAMVMALLARSVELGMFVIGMIIGPVVWIAGSQAFLRWFWSRCTARSERLLARLLAPSSAVLVLIAWVGAYREPFLVETLTVPIAMRMRWFGARTAHEFIDAAIFSVGFVGCLVGTIGGLVQRPPITGRLSRTIALFASVGAIPFAGFACGLVAIVVVDLIRHPP